MCQLGWMYQCDRSTSTSKAQDILIDQQVDRSKYIAKASNRIKEYSKRSIKTVALWCIFQQSKSSSRRQQREWKTTAMRFRKKCQVPNLSRSLLHVKRYYVWHQKQTTSIVWYLFRCYSIYMNKNVNLRCSFRLRCKFLIDCFEISI